MPNAKEGPNSKVQLAAPAQSTGRLMCEFGNIFAGDFRRSEVLVVCSVQVVTNFSVTLMCESSCELLCECRSAWMAGENFVFMFKGVRRREINGLCGEMRSMK
jgi:hypothetical protein